ncbi:MAG TPA: N-acyl homoserine lactonase family protein [Candidatus Binataceae bacterium]|nr:N-acyl homoserine lactonase family protein [Candidatus Binataceae bacterium]
MSVRIHPMVCGWLEVDTKFLLDQQPGRVKIPIPSFLIDHPKGQAVFDTGLHRSLQTNSDRIGDLARVFTVHYRQGEDLGGRLRARGFEPERIDYLINSHLHFDHAGGNADVPNAKLVIQRREWEAGADPGLIRKNGYNRADFDLGHQLKLIDGEHDLFGDGSVVCIPTYGHTAGHQSLRVRLDSGETVLTADSCYMRKVLDEMVLPPFADSYDAMRQVIERFRTMERAGARLIFGHDPAQWRDDGSIAVALG